MGYIRALGQSLLRMPATPLRVDALEDKVDSGEKADTIVASGQLSGYATCEWGLMRMSCDHTLDTSLGSRICRGFVVEQSARAAIRSLTPL